MTLNEASGNFERRYFEWARHEAQNEIRTNFQTLEKVNNVETTAFIALLRGLQDGEKEKVLSLYQRKAFEHLSSPLSQSERRSFEEFRQQYVHEMAKLDQQRSQIKKKLNTRSFKTMLVNLLNCNLGVAEQFDSAEWQWRTPVLNWLMITDIEIEKNALFYRQHISTGRSSTRKFPFQIQTWELLFSDISIQRWFGLGFDTSWDLTIANDESKLAESILACCTYYLRAAPTLLRGLEIDV